MATSAASSSTPTREASDDLLPGELATVAAAAGAATAGAAHLLAVPDHWQASGLMSAFFLGVGAAQLLLAAALRWRLPGSIVVVVIVGHLAVMGLYIASRTVDLPFVPPHGPAHEAEYSPVPRAVGDGIPVYPGSRVEPVGVLDLVCLGAELLLVVALAALLPPRLRGATTTFMAVAAAVAVAWRFLVVP